VRYVTSGVIMLIFAAILGFRSGAGPLAFLASTGLIVVFAFALCWVFTTLAMVVKQPRSVQGLGALIMLPLSFASNVFVPASTMPGWLRAFVDVNPVSQTVSAVRGLLTGGPVAGPATFALVSAAVIIAIFAPLAVMLYRRRT
jgi:oleandomycin transport system permease protein